MRRRRSRRRDYSESRLCARERSIPYGKSAAHLSRATISLSPSYSRAAPFYIPPFLSRVRRHRRKCVRVCVCVSASCWLFLIRIPDTLVSSEGEGGKHMRGSSFSSSSLSREVFLFRNFFRRRLRARPRVIFVCIYIVAIMDRRVVLGI